MKATLVALLGYSAFFVAWVWYHFRPAFNKATGIAVYKAVLLYDPLFWLLGVTAAFGSASLYLLLVRQ